MQHVVQQRCEVAVLKLMMLQTQLSCSNGMSMSEAFLVVARSPKGHLILS